MRYHGGKWRLAPWIMSHFPAHRAYVEPYAGAGSIFFRKPRSFHEVVNDLNGDMVNVYRVLRDPASAEQLRAALEFTPFAREEFNASFGPDFAKVVNPIERARLTLLRSMAGFGSAGFRPDYSTGFRGKSRRSHTTPAHDWNSWKKVVPSFTERLAGCVIENMKALDLIEKYDDAETLFYIDPPYLPSTRSSMKSTGRYVHEMTEKDHRRLAKLLRSLKGSVILSGYHSELYSTIFRDWRRVEREALADGARKRVEVLWFNFSPAVEKPA